MQQGLESGLESNLGDTALAHNAGLLHVHIDLRDLRQEVDEVGVDVGPDTLRITHRGRRARHNDTQALE
eukprot:10148356-Lingulodinium_polyedra.AAC.1